MMGKHLRRRFSLQPSFMKDDNADDKPKRDKFDRHEIDAAIIESAAKREEPYRIVVLGPEKVGKTALICRFLEKDFPLKHRATSEQTNFGTYTLAGVKVKLEILDTSGKNEFPAMRNLSLQRGDAFILVYDVTNAETFEEVRRIRDDIHKVRQTNTIPIVVVGNKIDLADSETREVDSYTTESVVSVDWENGFVEASAKENENVNKIFKELLLQAKLAYKLSPTLRKNHSRRQSLPPNQSGSGSSMHSQPGSCPPSTVHVPSPLQLQHLQQIQARNSRGKRNSCILS